MKLTDPRIAVLDVLDMLVAMAGLLAIAVFAGKAWALWAVGALFANNVIGAAVCAWADDENESLRKWADDAPSIVLEALITQVWPLILWLRLKERA